MHHVIQGYGADDDLRIWRYLDFTKFVSVLDTQALFFARADLLGDPFEGSYPKANIQSAELFESLLPPGVPWEPQGARKLGEDVRGLVKDRMRTHVFVNCWHMNQLESAAMWKLYVKSEEGIAVQSTVRRFKDSFTNCGQNILIAGIRYLDYETDSLGEASLLAPFLNKRKSFEHERELRAVYWDSSCLEQPSPGPKTSDPPAGLLMQVDMDTLIERVFVAPNAPQWFHDLVLSVLHRYSFPRAVTQSQLAQSPLW